MNSPPLRLAPAAQSLMCALHDALRPTWVALPKPPYRQPSPGQHPQGSALPPYRAAPVPDDLQGRRVELIVEASDMAAWQQALNSDADALVIDFDDTFAPTRRNVQAAYDALTEMPLTNKALLVRPRALYAVEEHLDFGGPAIAALCDLSAALGALPERPPHFYLPKLETVPEALFWDEALRCAERHLGRPENSLRVCLQIETFSGLLQADALLHALHQRAYGLNAGRWDYVFSLTKHLGNTRPQPIPPRRELTMDVDAMRAYAEELVRVCRERGAEAIGGTASLSPDPACPQPAQDAVVADKRREAAQGFTAAWAGLPALLDAVREGFAGQSQVQVAAANPALYARLTDLPDPSPLAVTDVQDAISLSLSVFSAWYAGQGVVTRQGRIEDTATAELARTQLWQWVRVQAALNDGTRLIAGRYRAERQKLLPDDAPASRLLDALVLSPVCPDYFPRTAQQMAAQQMAVQQIGAQQITANPPGVTP